MKRKYVMLLPIFTLLISLFFSVGVVQAQSGLMLETRRSALVKTLTENQLESGGFAAFTLGSSTEGDSYHTAQILIILEALDALEKINLQKAINRIIEEQNMTIGNTTIWGWPARRDSSYLSDLDLIHTILTALKIAKADNQVNQAVLIDFILSRYNESDGSFHEPVTEIETVNGKQKISQCGFPLEFYSISDIAYSNSNMISTFLGVSALSQLGALEKINVTKTLGWILSCKGENGAFKPFPDAHASYLPPWTSFQTNPFYVDSYGTGIAYTYAAILALETVKHLNDSNVIEKEKLRNYVLQCQEDLLIDNRILFRAHIDDQRVTLGIGSRHYTYYAAIVLQRLGLVEQEKQTMTRASSQIINEQNLEFADIWPVPNGPRFYGNGRKGNVYGLFLGDFLPIRAARFSVGILSVSENLYLLDQLSPAASKAWYNLPIFAISLTGLTVIGVLCYTLISSRKGESSPVSSRGTHEMRAEHSETYPTRL